jgi:hypothetical protein
MNHEERQSMQPNIKKLMIFIGIVFAAFVLYAIFGSLFTGNTPTDDKGVGAVNSSNTYALPADTLAGDTIR